MNRYLYQKQRIYCQFPSLNPNFSQLWKLIHPKLSYSSCNDSSRRFSNLNNQYSTLVKLQINLMIRESFVKHLFFHFMHTRSLIYAFMCIYQFYGLYKRRSSYSLRNFCIFLGFVKSFNFIMEKIEPKNGKKIYSGQLFEKKRGKVSFFTIREGGGRGKRKKISSRRFFGIKRKKKNYSRVIFQEKTSKKKGWWELFREKIRKEFIFRQFFKKRRKKEILSG